MIDTVLAKPSHARTVEDWELLEFEWMTAKTGLEDMSISYDESADLERIQASVEAAVTEATLSSWKQGLSK